VASWTFLTTHARVLLLVAHDPGIRLRDIAASLDITERGAFGIITDLVEAGYVVKEREGRRNRYHIQADLPLPEPTGRERTVGEVLALLTGTDATVTGKPAAAADSPDPGSGRDGQRAVADQVSVDLLLGGPPAGRSTMAGRNENSPGSVNTGREEAGT
jgi:MarR family